MTWEEIKKALEPLVGDNTELIQQLKEYEDGLTQDYPTMEEIEALREESRQAIEALDAEWRKKFADTFFGRNEASDVVVENDEEAEEAPEEIKIEDLFE